MGLGFDEARACDAVGMEIVGAVGGGAALVTSAVADALGPGWVVVVGELAGPPCVVGSGAWRCIVNQTTNAPMAAAARIAPATAMRAPVDDGAGVAATPP